MQLAHSRFVWDFLQIIYFLSVSLWKPTDVFKNALRCARKQRKGSLMAFRFSAIQIKHSNLHLWEKKVGISSRNTPEFTPGHHTHCSWGEWVAVSKIEQQIFSLFLLPGRRHSPLLSLWFCWACGVPLPARWGMSWNSIEVCSRYRLPPSSWTGQVFVLSC